MSASQLMFRSKRARNAVQAGLAFTLGVLFYGGSYIDGPGWLVFLVAIVAVVPAAAAVSTIPAADDSTPEDMTRSKP